MRFRTSAALTLVLALLASSLSTLACGFECFPAPGLGVSVEVAPAAPAQDSCHRKVEHEASSELTLGAVPHDCATHAPLIPRLVQPNASASLLKATSSMPALSSSPVNASLAGMRTRISASRDLAPPGRTPGLLAPLRI